MESLAFFVVILQNQEKGSITLSHPIKKQNLPATGSAAPPLPPPWSRDHAERRMAQIEGACPQGGPQGPLEGRATCPSPARLGQGARRPGEGCVLRAWQGQAWLLASPAPLTWTEARPRHATGHNFVKCTSMGLHILHSILVIHKIVGNAHNSCTL